MKPIVGEIIDQFVLVKKPKDVGRLYQKSQFGETLSGNMLQLNLIESCFLLVENKLIIHNNKEKISLEKLISIATEFDESFEEKYLIFSDLRKRGIQTRISESDEFTFTCEKIDEKTNKINKFLISVYSERQKPSLFDLKKLIISAEQKKSTLWLGIVDEEGDITYYEVSIIDPNGINTKPIHGKSTGLLLSNRVIIFENEFSTPLYEKNFFGKPFADGLQLSLVEALYLLKKNMLSCYQIGKKNIVPQDFEKYISSKQSDIFLRYHVFEDLMEKGLILKTGFKFGTHFRAYKKNPFLSHAEYIIQAIDEKYKTQWSEISRAVRLAHAVNKVLLYALIYNFKQPPEYLSIQRLRP